jgi:hypothetical protein
MSSVLSAFRPFSSSLSSPPPSSSSDSSSSPSNSLSFASSFSSWPSPPPPLQESLLTQVVLDLYNIKRYTTIRCCFSDSLQLPYLIVHPSSSSSLFLATNQSFSSNPSADFTGSQIAQGMMEGFEKRIKEIEEQNETEEANEDEQLDSRRENRYILFPFPSSQELTLSSLLSLLQTPLCSCLSQSEYDRCNCLLRSPCISSSPSVSLAIVDADSTLVYYQIRSGLSTVRAS